MNQRYITKEMPASFIAPYAVIDTANHPVHFSRVTMDALDSGYVELFDIEEEAIAAEVMANELH